nr:reverse transcriptase domain-containing protein [Tanacetum cinerariifolium]
MTANKINVADEAYEEYSQEVLGFSDVTTSGSPTPFDDPVVSTTSPTLTPFGDSDFLLFEEADAFLGLEDDPDSSKLDPSYYDLEGDILSLEPILNSDPSPLLPNHEKYVPSFKEELKACEAKTIKSSIDEPPEVELKDLPLHLEYAFLEGNNKFPLNEATRKDHFPLPFMDQMLKRLAGNEYYCFLDGFSSAKGTKRGVFRMPIPNELITADIRGEQYYKEYLEKVAKHQRNFASEKGSDPDSPAPKPAKATKKSKPLAPKAILVTKPAIAEASESTSSQQPKPKPAPAKNQEKKLDEVVDEDIPEREPRFDDKEADMQRAVEESLKSVHDAYRGLLPPVVIREPHSGKFQSLLEVQGKGKEKVSNEQVALDLLTLQTPKKVSHAEQYIFQRRTLAPSKPSRHVKSLSIYMELGLTNSDTKSDEEGSSMVRSRAQDEGQGGPNPGVQIESQAGSNPGDDAEPQPQSSPVVHARPNLEHIDLEATGTLSSLQHLAKDFSFGDQFFNDKPSKAENEKTTAETEAELMVKKKKRHDSPKTPPGYPPHQPPPPPPQAGPSRTLRSPRASGSSQLPPPPSLFTSQSAQSKSIAAPSSLKTAASTKYTAWTTTDTRLRPSVSLIPKDLHMDDDMAPDEQVHLFDDEDIENAHTTKVNLQQA